MKDFLQPWSYRFSFVSLLSLSVHHALKLCWKRNLIKAPIVNISPIKTFACAWIMAERDLTNGIPSMNVRFIREHESWDDTVEK